MRDIENSMCYDITSDSFDEELRMYNPIKYKSKMEIGNLTVYNKQHFNKFQKFMWKILLGIKIEEIEMEV